MRYIITLTLMLAAITALMPASNGQAIEMGVSQRCYNRCLRQAQQNDWTDAQLQACYNSCTIYR